MAKKKKLNVRQKAARRTASGGFTRVIFNRIGGKECPRFVAMTWKEGDVFMKDSEAVRSRYEAHMKGVK